MAQKFMVEKSGVEKFIIDKSDLKGPGLNLGVEKSRVEMSFNPVEGLEEYLGEIVRKIRKLHQK